jgi:hypothetical protein
MHQLEAEMNQERSTDCVNVEASMVQNRKDLCAVNYRQKLYRIDIEVF